MLHTERLVLNELSMDDIDDIHDLHSLPETDQYNTLGIPQNLSVTSTLVGLWLGDAVQNPGKTFIFTIKLKESNQFIGLIALILGKSNFKNAEVWYKIHVDYWRQGYTSEALNRILIFGFNDLGLHRVEAGCAVDNVGSIRVLEKAGMIREGMKRLNLPIREEWQSSYMYAILQNVFSN